MYIYSKRIYDIGCTYAYDTYLVTLGGKIHLENIYKGSNRLFGEEGGDKGRGERNQRIVSSDTGYREILIYTRSRELCRLELTPVLWANSRDSARFLNDSQASRMLNGAMNRSFPFYECSSAFTWSSTGLIFALDTSLSQPIP